MTKPPSPYMFGSGGLFWIVMESILINQFTKYMPIIIYYKSLHKDPSCKFLILIFIIISICLAKVVTLVKHVILRYCILSYLGWEVEI